MHLHQSVEDLVSGQNIFSNADGTASERFVHFIGGLQTYTPDLMPLYAPNVNAYRRYVAGSQAPVNVQWGYDNRTTGLRVPISAPAARRVENRLAGADANPYLAMAATLAAGLAGMQERCAATKPLDGNAYASERQLPCTFDDALDQMRQSAHAPRLLGADFVQAYLAVKSQELAHYQTEVSAWERRYLLPQV